MGYFPENTFDDFVASWYSSELNNFEEPSIYKQKSDVTKEVYRFTWLRSFDNPISIRIEIHDQDNATLYAKRAIFVFGDKSIKINKAIFRFDLGRIKIKKRKRISGNRLRYCLEIINDNKFWSLPKYDRLLFLDGARLRVLDGARWIIEGLSKGNYHIVTRQSPNKGGVKEIGLHFLKLSRLWVYDIY